MKHEFITTQSLLLKMHSKCDARLLNVVFEEVHTIYSNYSNFWKFSDYFIDTTSQVGNIDKVQVVTLFLISGGIVEFDGYSFNSMQHYDLWSYMYSHKYISDIEYDFLKSHWGFGEKITFME